MIETTNCSNGAETRENIVGVGAQDCLIGARIWKLPSGLEPKSHPDEAEKLGPFRCGRDHELLVNSQNLGPSGQGYSLGLPSWGRNPGLLIRGWKLRLPGEGRYLGLLGYGWYSGLLGKCRYRDHLVGTITQDCQIGVRT